MPANTSVVPSNVPSDASVGLHAAGRILIVPPPNLRHRELAACASTLSANELPTSASTTVVRDARLLMTFVDMASPPSPVRRPLGNRGVRTHVLHLGPG